MAASCFIESVATHTVLKGIIVHKANVYMYRYCSACTEKGIYNYSLTIDKRVLVLCTPECYPLFKKKYSDKIFKQYLMISAINSEQECSPDGLRLPSISVEIPGGFHLPSTFVPGGLRLPKEIWEQLSRVNN